MATIAAIAGAAATAYGAYSSSKAQKRAANARWEETNQPWEAAMPYLTDALPENKRLYDQVLANYQSRFGGAGGSQATTAGGGKSIAGDTNGNGILSRRERRALGGGGAQSQTADGDGGGESGGGGGRRRRGGLPDTMSQGGFFADEAQKFFDPSALDPESDPTLQPYIDALKREFQEDLERQLADVDDASNAVGMYGGSGRALEASRTREEGSEALANQLAQVYLGQRQGALDRQMEGLGLVSGRDIAAGQQAVQLRGINSAAATARRGQSLAANQFNQQMARQDTLMPMSIYGDYLKGLGTLTNLGPSTSSGKGARGSGGSAADPTGAGLASLGGGLMSLYGSGAFNSGWNQPAAASAPAGTYYGMGLNNYNWGYG